MINQSVLVLNSAYSPLYVTTVQKAFNLLFRDKAEVIEVENKAWISYNRKSWEEISTLKSELEENFKFLRGCNDYVLGVPKVIRLVKYAKQNLRINLTRKNIFLRDDNTCQYCNKQKRMQDLNIDHIIPRAQGGRNTWDNLVCSCIDCNSRKGSRTPKEAGLTLIKQPTKPSMYIMFKHYLNRMDEDPFKDWVPFFPNDMISQLYWNTELIE